MYYFIFRKVNHFLNIDYESVPAINRRKLSSRQSVKTIERRDVQAQCVISDNLT